MTRPTTTGKAQDLITFTRSTTGTALAKISYGEELVTNGDFSSDSDWTKGGSWAISGGLATATADGTSQFLTQDNNQVTVADKLYKFEYKVTVNTLSGGAQQLLLSTAGVFGSKTLNSSVGVHVDYFISSNPSGEDVRLFCTAVRHQALFQLTTSASKKSYTTSLTEHYSYSTTLSTSLALSTMQVVTA